MNIDDETIVARSTAKGFAAIAVIRLSGPKTKEIFRKATDLSAPLKHRRVFYCNFINSGNLVDEVLVTFFKAPDSYTGEDLCEISSHGSPAIVKEIIGLCIEAGARYAQPGEFTKRRFLNNKIDLTQAEGINNLIHSQTEAAAKSSRSLLNGKIGERLKEIKQEIIDNISILELELDFTEEAIEHITEDKLKNNIILIIGEIESLIKTYKYGRLVLNGLNIALTGPPNSGKSSLLNAIIQEERAITSSQAGTTRDFIQESIEHDGYKLTFIDTAGIRKPLDSIENKGINKAKKIIQSCDLKLLVIDPGQDYKRYKEFINKKGTNTLFVINKIDINKKETISDFINNFNMPEPIFVSALEHTNIEELNDAIVEWLEEKKPEKEDHIITVQRQYDILKKTKQELSKTIKAIDQGFTSEFIVTDLRHALSSLDNILGKTTNNEILNNIFSNFCIGK